MTTLNTMQDVKNVLNQIEYLVLDVEFRKAVAKVAKANGCTEQEWEANKMPILVKFAQNYILNK